MFLNINSSSPLDLLSWILRGTGVRGNPSYCPADVGRKMRPEILRMPEETTCSFIPSLHCLLITASVFLPWYSCSLLTLSFRFLPKTNFFSDLSKITVFSLTGRILNMFFCKTIWPYSACVVVWTCQAHLMLLISLFSLSIKHDLII